MTKLRLNGLDIRLNGFRYNGLDVDTKLIRFNNKDYDFSEEISTSKPR